MHIYIKSLTENKNLTSILHFNFNEFLQNQIEFCFFFGNSLAHIKVSIPSYFSKTHLDTSTKIKN